MRNFMKVNIVFTVSFILVCSCFASLSFSQDKATRRGKVSRDIGIQSYSFGSNNQAIELLKLMQEHPGKMEYKISYTTEGDAVVFGCKFDKNILIRIHQYPDGRGKSEVWQGYIEERVRAGASGGSLNDTPKGKIFSQNSSY